MRIPVPGGAGFIGSHVADQIVQLGHQVVVLDDLSSGSKTNVNPRAELVEGDITDDQLLADLFQTPEYNAFHYRFCTYKSNGGSPDARPVRRSAGAP